MPDYLLLEEVAEIARAPVETVRGWIRSGRLPSVKPGRWRLVRRADFERFLLRDSLQERRALEQATADNRASDGRFLPSPETRRDD